MHRRSLAGVLAVALGFTMVAVAITGIGNDWLGGWLVRCGGKWSRHRCEAGEIPWGLVFWGVMAILLGMAVASAEMTVRRGRAAFTWRFQRALGADAGRAGSEPPPAPRDSTPPSPATDLDALSRKIGL